MAVLGFGSSPTGPALRNPSYHDLDPELQIIAWSAASGNWTEMLAEPVNTTVAGRPARYRAAAGSASGLLLVQVGSCGLQIRTRDRAAVTRADLEAMFIGATFDECDGMSSWTRPLR